MVIDEMVRLMRESCGRRGKCRKGVVDEVSSMQNAIKLYRMWMVEVE